MALTYTSLHLQKADEVGAKRALHNFAAVKLGPADVFMSRAQADELIARLQALTYADDAEARSIERAETTIAREVGRAA